MADIRIKDEADTATLETLEEDDYALIDGATAGTRRILASLLTSGDPFGETSNATESSPWTLSGVVGNAVHRITALDTDLTINKPTGTFNSARRQWIILDIVASGATRTLTLGTGINKAGGADLNLAIPAGEQLILTLYTYDGGTNFLYDGDLAIASYPLATMDPENDHILVADAGDSDKPKRALLPPASTSGKGIVQLAADAAAVSTGTNATDAVTPDTLAGSNFGTRLITFPLNGSTALTTSDAAFQRIPAEMNGMDLVGVRAAVGTGSAGSSSSGAVTLTVTNVTSGQSMLSTNITIDQGEYSTATAATPAVINTSEDDVATDDLIRVACTGAGTGVTYASVTLAFRLP